MEIAFLHRGRINPLPDAEVEPLSSNAWLIHFTVSERIQRFSRRRARLEDWDGVTFVIDDQDTEPAIATAVDGDQVTVTVMVLG